MQEDDPKSDQEEAKKAMSAYKKAWREKNKDRVNAYASAWRKKNKDKVREYNQTYWQRKGTEQLNGDK